MIYTHTFEVKGKSLNIEVGRVALQAGGSVLFSMEDTIILATATMSSTAREVDFLPLTCDFEERKYAQGKIPPGFDKRGGRPSTKSILRSRLIDRPIRPLFPKGLRHDIQVIVMPLAQDSQFPTDALAICAAGAALSISDIPFDGPAAGVHVVKLNDQWIAFPNQEEIANATVDMILAGHKGAVSMIESGSIEASEEEILEGLEFGHEVIEKICSEIETFAKQCGKPKRSVSYHSLDAEMVKKIGKAATKEITDAIFNPDKASRESAISEITQELVEKYTPTYESEPSKLADLPVVIDKIIKDAIRTSILKKEKRPDGRNLKQIRPLSALAGILPVVHGSGLFTRGQTQVLTLCTLGMPSDAQKMDDEVDKRFNHYYNFPPYSTGEVKPLRGASRREVGHGALAERALLPVIPLKDPDFSYTVHLVSEVLESNGSSSMASICASTLALMDAGVPISAPVAGIAMGLMSDGKVYKVLTDIQGMEDFCGDMDFKVAGTRKGITALQLDTKLDGIPIDVLRQALEQAREARFEILDTMEAEISVPRSEMSPTAPKISVLQINPEKIGSVIGPGGAVIRKITAATGAQIDIEQDGRVLIGGSNKESVDAAIKEIQALTIELKAGMLLTGKVTRLMGKGAMVEILPGKDGLVPTEKIADPAPNRPDDVLKVGDTLQVKITEVDSMGRVNLTAIELDKEYTQAPRDRSRDRDNRDNRDRGRGRDDRGNDSRGDRSERYSRGDRFDARKDRNDNRPPRSQDNSEESKPENSEYREKTENSSRPEKQHTTHLKEDRNSRPRNGNQEPRLFGNKAHTNKSEDIVIPDSFPKRESSGEDSVHSRFRPRR